MYRTVFLMMVVLAFSSGMSQAQSWFETGQDADLMLSGVDFNNTGGALSFNHPNGIASDGTHFLVCDRFNNRVLVWNSLPESWDDEPDLVLGQPDFIQNDPGTEKNQMNWPGNVSVSANGMVAVTDTENDRILIWNDFPTESGEAADIEIDFVEISDFGSNLRYSWPWGVWTDGSKLSAISTAGGYLMFWDEVPTTDNVSPDYTIQLDDMGTPRNISTDGSTYFFVGDHNAEPDGVTENEAGTFFWNSYPSEQDQDYDFYRSEWIKGVKLDDGRLVAAGSVNIYVWDEMPTTAAEDPDFSLRDEYYSNGDAPDVVYVGEKLYVNNYNGNNVQVYDGIPSLAADEPEFVIGSESNSHNTLDDINYIQNPVMTTNGEVFVVTSDFDRTLWLWNTTDFESGQAPDVKIPLTAQNIDAAPWDNAIYGDYLVAAGKKKVLVWESIPVNGEEPDYLLQDAIGSFTINEIKGVAMDEEFLYLADKYGQVALFAEVPESESDEPDMILNTGYNSLSLMHSDGTYLTVVNQDITPAVLIYKVSELVAGTTAPYKTVTITGENFRLNLPASAVTFNGSLAIANTGNSSVFLWEDLEDAGDRESVIVLGKDDPEVTDAEIGINSLFNPASLFAYDNKLWVGEVKFSSRIVQYSYEVGTATEDENLEIPGQFGLDQNYPNPFNPSTVISYQLPENSLVRLQVFDMLGREVASLVDQVQTAGEYEVNFDASNLSSGIYLYRLMAGNEVVTRRMSLIK